MSNDDRYIYKALAAGMPPEMLAEKFNTTREDIISRGQEASKVSPEMADEGLVSIEDVYNLTCLQYNKMGEGLKIMAEHLSDPASVEEIAKVIGSGGGKTSKAIAKRLGENFIILKPFKAPALKVQELPGKS